MLCGHAVVFDDRVRAIVLENELCTEELAQVVRLSGQTILPGFIDVHIHGCGGCDTMDGTQDSQIGRAACRERVLRLG